MKLLFLIGCGGFIGAVARYLISGIPHKYLDTAFPLGTLLVNVLGSLAIGFFLEYSFDKDFSNLTRMAIVVGVLGGFTTYSSFSFETLNLLRTSHYTHAFLNILITNTVCISGAALGLFLGKKF